MENDVKYEIALERAKEAVKKGFVSQDLVAEIFRAESENERVRKALVSIVKWLGFDSSFFIDNFVTKSEVLAWLEKQKEYPTNEEMLRTLRTEYEKGVADTIAKYEQKEQKPILEVFGFKVGDKVRLKDGDGRTHIIKSFEEVEGLHGPNFYHVIFEDDAASDHIIPGKEYIDGYFTHMEKIEEKEKKPDYTDEYKKCLENQDYFIKNYFTVKQKPAEWSEEDEKMLQYIVSDLREFRDCETDEELISDYEDEISWLKSLKNRGNFPKSNTNSLSWSEEDEKIAKEIEEELWYPGDFPDYPSKEESELYDDCQRRLDWFKNKLKSLRLSWKPVEWSDEDKAALTSILYCISQAIKNVNDENERNSLLNAKSWIQDKLKFHIPSRISHPRSSWKPSEEQMEALLWCTAHLGGADHRVLAELYEHLKKLV